MSDRRKKPRMMEEDREDIITLRLLVNGKEAGTLIGKGGLTVSALRQSSDAIINISDNSTKERIVSATGDLESVVRAFNLISQTLLENLYNNDISDHPLVYQILVPAGQCGSLIGPGGAKIKTIREESGASVRIDSDSLPRSSERMITVSGTQECISSCVRTICEIMTKYPVRGHTMPYNPEQVERSQSSYYGLQRSSSSGQARYSTDSSRRRKRSDDYYDDDYMSDHMSIPSQFAGSVIGKRGHKINEIRGKSGASVKIADEAEGSSERIVTVSGTPEAVGMAKYLIKTRIEFEQKKANGEA